MTEAHDGAAGELRRQIHALTIDRRIPAPRPRRPAIIAAAGAVVLVAGAVLLLRHTSGAARATVPVVYPRLSTPPAPSALTGTGHVVAGEKYVAMGVRLPVRVRRYLVEVGERVDVGQDLVEIDDRDLRANMKRAEASLAEARADLRLAAALLRRLESLFPAGVVSAEEIDVAVRRHDVAAATVTEREGAVELAQAHLDEAVLQSPVRGVVLAKLKAVGEVAVPGGFPGSGDLLRLADLSELRAEVDVNEADVPRLSLGQPVEVLADANPTRTYHGTVMRLHPQVDRQKGTILVESRITDADERLLPDMRVRVRFAAPEVVDASPSLAGGVLVPRAAMRDPDGSPFAWVVADGAARRRAVVLGPVQGDFVVVTGGLSAADAVITGPVDQLTEGVPVKALEAKSDAGS